MQPGWLKQYFKPQDENDGEQAGERHDETAPDDDVSRRDFVKTGFVAGMAAGMAAGSVAGGVAPAEAQTANPVSRQHQVTCSRPLWS